MKGGLLLVLSFDVLIGDMDNPYQRKVEGNEIESWGRLGSGGERRCVRWWK
jgi:hypothetical protein